MYLVRDGCSYTAVTALISWPDFVSELLR